MRCPRCDAKLNDNLTHCNQCGMDLAIIKHIYRISNAYYNKGLEKAQVRDLSGAVTMLRKSLQYNKKNTDARNLLGLVLNEMGETVAALSEWVLSRYLQQENNEAERYIKLIQNNPIGLDSVSQTIKKYNSALSAARSGNEDLAVIQLKKVVSLNPKFVRAYQLLALLYIKSRDFPKAYKYLKRARKIDYNNTMTLRYMCEVNMHRDLPDRSGKAQEEQTKPKKDPLANVVPVGSYREEKKSWLPFINVIIGIFVGVLVTFFLIRPTLLGYENGESSDVASVKEELVVKEAELSAANSKIDKLNKTVEQLQSEAEAGNKAQTDKLTAYGKLLVGVNLYYKEGKKVEAAASVASYKKSDFETEEAQALYEEIARELTSADVQSLFESGRASCNSGKYEDAIRDLELALSVEPENQDVLYFLGRTYHKQNKKKKAISYYEQLLKVDDTTSRASEAKMRLRELGMSQDDIDAIGS